MKRPDGGEITFQLAFSYPRDPYLGPQFVGPLILGSGIRAFSWWVLVIHLENCETLFKVRGRLISKWTGLKLMKQLKFIVKPPVLKN